MSKMRNLFAVLVGPSMLKHMTFPDEKEGQVVQPVYTWGNEEKGIELSVVETELVIDLSPNLYNYIGRVGK